MASPDPSANTGEKDTGVSCVETRKVLNFDLSWPTPCTHLPAPDLDRPDIPDAGLAWDQSHRLSAT